MALNRDQRTALLSSTTSRRNKIWLLTTYQVEGAYVVSRWLGKPYQSRISFQFEEGGEFIVAKSYDEDILPFLETNEPKVKK